MKKIIVYCPVNVVTGGPELLHQFVSNLRSKSVDARILYYPFSKDNKTPQPYEKYDIELATPCDCKEAIVVLPEVATKYAYKLDSSEVVIWWLSVDNYYKAYPKSWSDKIKALLKKVLYRDINYLTLDEIKSLNSLHLTQSHYGYLFLKQQGISNITKVGDYLNEEHLNKRVDKNKKENIVCYNPKKGRETTNLLISSMPNVRFVPIENMTATQVSELLSRSKLYIDFGEHPGKDRIPREAAMAGCVVVTGRKGSADNSVDIPVSHKYKIEEKDPFFIDKMADTITSIFENYDDVYDDFEDYRVRIAKEKEEFDREVNDFIDAVR